ncbi:MAG TPA: hypothetical protein VGP36_12715 [Mycobacteriales bacterium]|jgi:hypothetical protein|nr:hypothetical protein [Mycobacteriales bacterium]
MERVLSRRTLLRAAGVAGLGVPLLASCTSPTAPASPASRRTDPVSVAMHLHSSFSEGTASMAAHLAQAERLGVDVLFWTDHDFRISAQGYRRRLGLAGSQDAEHGVRCVWQQRYEGNSAGAVTFADGAAQLRAAGSGALWYDATAWNSTYSASLADTTLEVEVRPGVVGPDGYPALQIDLSYHPASGGRPAGQYRLTYRIGASDQIGWRADGLQGQVDVPAPAGWSTVKLHPVDDIGGLWPDLIAEDNSLHRLRVGVVGTASPQFRQVTIERGRRTRPLALMRDVMSRYADRYPDRRQYAALEVSLVRHLNWFGGQLVMPNYGEQAPIKDDSIPAAEQMVRLIHRYGGLASYNHPLGGTAEATAKHMVETKALGADIVEVAYAGPSTVDAMLHVLDACARNLVLITANGVTDDHSGTDWYSDAKSNWITRLWARSDELPDLQDALRAGRAWAYKPNGWTGAMEITASGSPGMGGVAVSADAAVPVTVTATDLPRDGTLEVVTGKADRVAPEPAIVSTRARGGRHSLDLPAGNYVRAVVRDADGRIVGLGNPLWALPDATGVPAERQLRA